MQIKRTGNRQFKNLQTHFLYVHLDKEKKMKKKINKEKTEIKHLLEKISHFAV